MKKQFTWALAAALTTSCLMTACSDSDDPVTPGGESGGNPDEPSTEAVSRYVIAAQAGGDNGGTYLVTTDNLDSG